MAGPRWSLEPDLAAKRWTTAARRILFRIGSFAPGSPARVLHDHEPQPDNVEFFNREGTSLVEALIAFILMATDPGAPHPEGAAGERGDGGGVPRALGARIPKVVIASKNRCARRLAVR